MNNSTVYTIGYWKRGPRFIMRKLKENGIKLVVDIREKTFSYKPAFTGKGLRRILKLAGIDYVHIPGLAVPKKIRQHVLRTGIKSFKKKYYEQCDDFVKLKQLIEVDKVACLFCSEINFEDCNRKFIADVLKERYGIVTEHL